MAMFVVAGGGFVLAKMLYNYAVAIPEPVSIELETLKKKKHDALVALANYDRSALRHVETREKRKKEEFYNELENAIRAKFNGQ